MVDYIQKSMLHAKIETNPLPYAFIMYAGISIDAFHRKIPCQKIVLFEVFPCRLNETFMINR